MVALLGLAAYLAVAVVVSAVVLVLVERGNERDFGPGVLHFEDYVIAIICGVPWPVTVFFGLMFLATRRVYRGLEAWLNEVPADRDGV